MTPEPKILKGDAFVTMGRLAEGGRSENVCS